MSTKHIIISTLVILSLIISYIIGNNKGYNNGKQDAITEISSCFNAGFEGYTTIGNKIHCLD